MEVEDGGGTGGAAPPSDSESYTRDSGEISLTLDMWRLISAPLHALFDNLSNAADSLHTVIMSLINSKREFCGILTPPSSQLEFTEYYSSFNKWLLGRLFYILSVDKLKKIHDISIETQLKILSILMSNSATFYDEICNDYIECGKVLIKYYNSLEEEDCELEVLHLRMLIPRLINIPNTDIDFSPIFINVSDKTLCRSLIKHLSKILYNIMPLSIALEEFKVTDEIVAQQLFILENFDFDLKITAIKFFTNILNEHGASNSEDFLIKFLLAIESLILYMPIYANNGLLYHSKQIQEFNNHIAQALMAVTSLNISSQEIRTSIELNVCKFVLGLDEPNADNESLHFTFNMELKRSCIKLLKKVFCTDRFITTVNVPVTKYFIKNASPLYISLIASQLKTHIYIDKNESKDVTLNVMKNSSVAERLFSALKFSLESACCPNIDLFVIREHLENCLNVLRILHDSSIDFYSHYQQYHGFHNAIFNIKVTDKHNMIHSNSKPYEERLRLFHIPRDKTKSIVKNITEIMNRILEKDCEPLPEIFMCMDICMMMLLLSIEISVDDLFSILKITRLTLNQPSFSVKFHEMLHLHSLNIISIQSILNYKEMKNNTIERLEVFDLNNTEIHAKILQLLPLFVINEILTPEKIISDYLFSALHLDDKYLLDVVITILPIITCVFHGHYAVMKSKHGDFTESVGYELPSVDGVHLSLICLHCYNCSDDNSIQKNLENHLKNNKTMLLLNKTRFNYSESNSLLISLFERLSSAEFYERVDVLKLYNFIVTMSQHSLIIPQLIDYILTEKNLQYVSHKLKTFFSIVLTDPKVDDSVKNNITNTFLTSLLNSVKSSLHENNVNQQLICLNAVRQFGMSRSMTVLLPSVKILFYFLMNPNTPFGFMTNFYTKDICESHNLSPNLVYHMYKKDFCRIMMGLLSWNYSIKQEFIPPILRVVRVFGFINYKEFISKEMHHALPFLIPLIVQKRKLRQIIPEISELISCNPSDFLYDRFPHIYAHVYIFSTDEIADKCYNYLVEIIKIPLPTLIKKHSRVILTELLFQYCCNPERVIKACRQLANIDCENATTNANFTIPLTQVADYIQPKILGVLAYFDSKLIHTKIAISVKRKALQSFPYILNLMGTKHITPLRFKILATLRTASTLMKEFSDLNIEAWDAFVRNIDTILLGSLLTTIVVSLLPLITYSSKKLNKIFQYLIVKNENILSPHIADLYFLETTDVSECIKSIVKRYVVRNQPKSFINKIQWYMKYLNQDTPEIKVYALKYLNELIKSQRRELDVILFGNKDYISVIADLLEILIVGCRNKDRNLAEWSSRCLGQIGALQPSLLPQKLASKSAKSQFAFTMRDISFAKMALIELAKAFQFEKNPKNMDCYSLAIQEILNSFNIRPQGENEEVWDSLPKNLHEIIVPLLLSRYTLAFPSNPEKNHPIFGSPSGTTFSEWGFNWARKLISHIKQENISYMLRMVHPALKRDLRTLVLFLPYIVLHTVTTNSDVGFIKEEIMSVIGLNSFNVESVNMKKLPDFKIMRYVNTTPSITPFVSEEGTHKKCCKMIYNLLDFFNRWLMEWCYNNNNSLQNNDYLKIKSFTNDFCKLTIARGNFLCCEYERSLQYLELYMEETPEQFQSQLGFLAEIYSVLNEPDSIAGIMSIKQNEPTLSESILAHEVMGQLQDAATCYEKLAQQGDFGGEKLQGMVKVYLGLDQPFTALKFLQDADVEFNGDGLAAESFWRLGMFEELDKMLSRPDVANNDTWGVNIGHCLLALRSGVRETLQEKLSLTRKALLRRLDSGASYMSLEENIYDRAYTSAFDLHMISEIEDIEDVIFKIKDLHDGDTDCVVIINHLIDEWKLRFNLLQSSKNIVEPVLRLRRILLEQSKELLHNTHPKIIPLLDTHIGKLWLQSAKFARKAGVYQQAYIYILNSEKYSPKELFIEKAKLYWMRNQQEPAFCTLKRGLEEHFMDTKKLTENDKKLCAKAKLLIAIYNDETTNVDMDVNIKHYKDAMSTYREWEKSLVCLGEYYEKIYSALTPSEKLGGAGCAARTQALDYYGRSLQYGHKKLYQSMPRMLTIWLDFEISSENKSAAITALTNICVLIETFTERLPLYLFLSAFSQIISRICHPIKEVYNQLKSIIIKLILVYPQHSIWMMMCVIKSGYSQRMKRCQDILNDHRLKEPEMQKFISHFNLLATNLIDLCNTPVNKDLQTFDVSSLVRNLPRILTTSDFSEIIMPHERFVKLSLPVNAARSDRNFNPFSTPVYIAGIEEKVVVLQSLQKPRKVTFLGSDGNRYIIMLKPKDDLRKDFRLMEFNAVVNRYLQDHPDARERRLYIRTYTVLPLNEECGLIEWVPNLVGLRPILTSIYKRKGLLVSSKQLRSFDCDVNDSITKKKKTFETELLPRHPPVFSEWFRSTFPDPHSWYQARSAYTRTTAVMSMVGYILGLGDRHGENILFDSTNGDTMHVDFNCLFNKGEGFLRPETVPFRLTHNMQSAMGPLAHEGMYRKCCEVTMHVLRAQTPTLMAIIRPFVYDPLVTWQKCFDRSTVAAERTNQSAKEHLTHIEHRLQGMVRTKDKQFTLSLSPEGQTNHLILEAISVVNLCQMYMGWGPFL